MSYLEPPTGSYQPGPNPQFQPNPQPNPQFPSNPQYDQLNRLLHTEDGFKNSIQIPRGIDAILGVVLVIAVLMLVRNLFMTFSAMSQWHLSSRYFWDVFFTTKNTRGQVDPGIWAAVYLPLIAIPIVIALIVVRRLTAGSVATKAFAQFNQNGFLTSLVATGIPIQMGNQKGIVYVLGAPNVPAEWVVTAAQRMTASATADRRSPETKQYVKTLRKLLQGTIGQVTRLANLADPTVPAGIFVTTGYTRMANPIRVAAPTADQTRLSLYALKKNVLPA